MKKIILTTVLTIITTYLFAQNPIGKWKIVSHISEYEGQKFDSHKALLTSKPCAAKIIIELNADASYRLNASNSGCEERYKKFQEKLYSKTNWQVKNGVITLSTLKDFAVGQSYKISISGSKMTWVGIDGQGTIVYQKQ